MMNFICVFMGIIICIAGIGFAMGKVHIRLTAWKAMPQEEKEKIKIIPLCRNIGCVIALNGMIFLLKGICGDFVNKWFTAAMIVWFLIAGFDVWFISKNGRYQK